LETIDTFIIGAGPAGLTAAYTLAKAGHGVLVIERDRNYVGGISRAVSNKGFLIDIGGHRFVSKSREVVAFWNEILPGDFLVHPRLSRIYCAGKFYAYPLRAFEVLRNLGVARSIACLASYAYARAFPVRDPKTFHQWMRNHFGERLFSIFFKTYTEKVWGMACNEMPTDWAARRFKGRDHSKVLTAGLRRSLAVKPQGGAPAKTLSEAFLYPRCGPGMMWEAAARKIQENGGRIVMDRKFEKLHFDPGRKIWTVDTISGDGTRETFEACHVVSSVPILELLATLSPAPLTLLHGRALKYRDFITVVLISQTQRAWPGTWIDIHDPRVKASRVRNFRSWSPGMVPEATSTCLGLEYFCREDDDLWSMTDADLIALAKQEISTIGLMAGEEAIDTCVVRQKKAYLVHDETYLENLAMIRFELASRFPGLHLVGHNGMHKDNNQDHAMMTGMLTAGNILARRTLYDVWAVNEDAEYGESGLSGAREALASARLGPQKVA
jgi:protoporphyrinogen oxidase